MTYKLGDRVVVVDTTHYKFMRGYDVGTKATITSMAGGYLFGLTLDGLSSNAYPRLYFRADEIEHDKNYIVTQILRDL